MQKEIIRVESVSKIYRLGEIGTGTLANDLKRAWANFRGKEDPFLKLGEENRRDVRGSEWVWALNEVSFSVGEGEVLGIIGKNGAGKSTLLKILSRVTAPTKGRILAKGRIASLLEVGTGFHPDLTGKENIYLNGAILGMTKKEITRKFDEIVDFAGIERYVDTPVKRYSSGMYVRLAFAVAAHLEPEILIVDEVLAVGDIEFQKKCLGKMKDVSVNEGRTVLFVSHNMGAVANLCNRAILMQSGTVKYTGGTEEVIRHYLKSEAEQSNDLVASKNRTGSQKVSFSGFYLQNREGDMVDVVMTGDDVDLVFRLSVSDFTAKRIDIGFSVHDSMDDLFSVTYSSYCNVFYSHNNQAELEVRCRLPRLHLAPGQWIIRGRIEVDGLESDWPKFPLGFINVEMGDFYGTGNLGHQNSAVKILMHGEWS